MPKGAQRVCEEIIRELKQNAASHNDSLIRKSFAFCVAAHGDQKRISGEPYWTHPANAALTLAQLGADSETIAATLLHDVLEDTPISESELRREFGSEVVELVKGVTKLDRLVQKGSENQYRAANLQKTLLASASDLRVMAVKLADRLHNLQTLQSKSKEDQVRIAGETLTVFAPIAHKLGIHDLKHALEDLSFSYLNTPKYTQVKEQMEICHKEKKSQILQMIRLLRPKMPRGTLFGIRNKPIFSIYTKMMRTAKPWNEIYDCSILVIEVPRVQDCYAALGALHTRFLPLPNKMKDFIAIPQPNLYQAIHASVIGPTGAPIKAYITTPRMLLFYHRGILALGLELPQQEVALLKERAKQLNNLFSMPYSFSETEEFMNQLMQESLSRTIFVFTPKGDLIELPLGSTPIDFAFKIHPWLGQRIWRAKVNGQFVGFDTRLENGNIVEIIPSRSTQVKKGWLDWANTISAKRLINHALQQKERQSKRSIDISIMAKDRVGLFADITMVFDEAKVNIDAAYAYLNPDHKAILQFNSPPLPSRQLKLLGQRLRNIPGILKVTIERA